MKRLILNLLAAMALVMVPATLLSHTAYAACAADSSSKGQVINGIADTGDPCTGKGVTDVVAAGVNILSIVVGIIAVIMVISGGLKYITSGGEGGKVANAKNTLLYALIGLTIAVLAQLLVHFVLFQSSNAIG